jgi:hypothetical protein
METVSANEPRSNLKSHWAAEFPVARGIPKESGAFELLARSQLMIE